MDSYDVKNYVFNELKTVLLADATMPSGLVVASAFDTTATTFPRVAFQELSIATKSFTLDYSNHTKTLIYQVDIFSKSTAADTELRKVAKKVNTVLEGTFHMVQRGSGNLASIDTVSKRYVMTYVGTFSELDGKFH
jgi:hypothetical protein